LPPYIAPGLATSRKYLKQTIPALEGVPAFFCLAPAKLGKAFFISI